MSESEHDAIALVPGAQRLLDDVAEQHGSADKTLGVNLWLLELLQHFGPMAESLASGLVAGTTLKSLRERVGNGDTGAPLSRQWVINSAMEAARSRGTARAVERDLARVILTAAGYDIKSATGPSPSTPASKEGEVVHNANGYRPRAPRPTPLLDQFGRDLTKAAAEGRLPPVVGRDAELELVVETLCRRTKRNPVLVGPAGVGKTAIVEALAQTVISGTIPAPLQDVRLIEVQPSSIVAGASHVGDLEERMKGLLREASQDGIVLFIDEIHSVVGSGGAAGMGDLASLLKPALARDALACIGATTDDEYRRFIEPDAALERRFQPIRVHELTVAQTLDVLRAIRDDLGRERGVRVDDGVLKWLVNYADRFMRNRTFPDKAVDLLEQSVGCAVARGSSSLDLADVEIVAQRMVGTPSDIGESLRILSKRLQELPLLGEGDTHRLVNRLGVTMRGLDLRCGRPNAVVLLTGEARSIGESLSQVLAETLFGASDRVVAIEFSRFTHTEDVNMLLGAPPGYVGYSDSLPLHQLGQIPWCVLRCQNIHACHPAILQILAQGLMAGFLTDARGRKIYLSDAVVVLTAQAEASSHHHIGFLQRSAERPQAEEHLLEESLGSEFLSAVDIVCTTTPWAEHAPDQQGVAAALEQWRVRCETNGLHVKCDETLNRWLAEAGPQSDWERLIDEHLTLAVVPYLTHGAFRNTQPLVVSFTGKEIQVVKHKTKRRERTNELRQ